MNGEPELALADALAKNGPWSAFVRKTETGERYVDLAREASDQPTETVWFDPGRAVWGDEFQYSTDLGDMNETAKVILYTMRDALDDV